MSVKLFVFFSLFWCLSNEGLWGNSPSECVCHGCKYPSWDKGIYDDMNYGDCYGDCIMVVCGMDGDLKVDAV